MNTEQKTNFQIADAYWISPNGEIYPVKMLHINFMRDNLALFEISEEIYRNTFIKYKEKFGFEGKARAELMKNAMKNGWIRLRNKGNSGWTIEVWKLDNNTKESIYKWADNFTESIKNGLILNQSENTPIEIHELEKQDAGKAIDLEKNNNFGNK
jgi:hypothetical protein